MGFYGAIVPAKGKKLVILEGNEEDGPCQVCRSDRSAAARADRNVDRVISCQSPSLGLATFTLSRDLLLA